MSRGNTPERARMMRALGAEVVLVDQADGISSQPGLGGGSGPGGTEDRPTGPGAAGVSSQPVRAEIQPAGSRTLHGARTVGAVRRLRRRVPGFRRLGRKLQRRDLLSEKAKSRNSRLHRGARPEPRCWPGSRSSVPTTSFRVVDTALPDLPLVDRSLVSGYLQVTDEDAIAAARLLAAEEGIFGGFSSGANLAASHSTAAKGRSGGPPSLSWSATVA